MRGVRQCWQRLEKESNRERVRVWEREKAEKEREKAEKENEQQAPETSSCCTCILRMQGNSDHCNHRQRELRVYLYYCLHKPPEGVMRETDNRHTEEKEDSEDVDSEQEEVY